MEQQKSLMNQPKGPVIIGQGIPVGRHPATLQCPRCQNQITTRTDRSLGETGCIIAVVLCVLG